MKKTSILFFTLLFTTSVISCNSKAYQPPINNVKTYNQPISNVQTTPIPQTKSTVAPIISSTKSKNTETNIKTETINTNLENITPNIDNTINDTNTNQIQEKESLTEIEIAHKYAPIIFQETNKESQSPSWDFITAFDFDNDLQANNNEESLKNKRFNLPSVVYYAVVETGTHYFIVYSFYHALDWSKYSSLIPFNWHENDMENIQIVVRKKTEKLPEEFIILSAQAHLDTEVSVPQKTKITSNKQKLSKEPVRLLSTDVRYEGTHCGVYVETGGHGIYNMNSNKDKFAQLEPPKLKEGLMLTPISLTRKTPDFYQDDKYHFEYQLRPIYNSLWSYYKNNENIGDGKLVDGYFDYKDEIVEHKKIPRFFDSDRMSGPGKYDSGIIPFAFSFTLSSDDLGVIFFNPAKKYAESLKIDEPWSRIYTYNPYLD